MYQMSGEKLLIQSIVQSSEQTWAQNDKTFLPSKHKLLLPTTPSAHFTVAHDNAGNVLELSTKHLPSYKWIFQNVTSSKVPLFVSGVSQTNLALSWLLYTMPGDAIWLQLHWRHFTASGLMPDPVTRAKQLCQPDKCVTLNHYTPYILWCINKISFPWESW